MHSLHLSSKHAKKNLSIIIYVSLLLEFTMRIYMLQATETTMEAKDGHAYYVGL